MACSSGSSFDTHYAARWIAGQFPKTWRFSRGPLMIVGPIGQKSSVR
jgi:hypothetical protein